MDKITLAYVAGLFDGEGSIVIGVSKPSPNRGTISPSHWLQVSITNTDRALIDWLHDKFGGHISDHSRSPSRRLQRPIWAWRVMSNKGQAFLELIRPYLRVKGIQADIAISFQKERAGYTGKTISKSTLLRREGQRTELRKLTLGVHSLDNER